MAYKAREVEMTYDFGKVVPAHDPDLIYFEGFKKTFGEDGNMIVIGVNDSSLYTPDNFYKYKLLSDELAKIKGVKNVLSLPRLYRLSKDTEKTRFVPEQVFTAIPEDQASLDSLLQKSLDLKFYQNRIYNTQTGATLILLTLDQSLVNSPYREVLLKDIVKAGSSFSDVTNIELHYAGLPYVRTLLASKVKEELNFFLILSIIVTAMILATFFRAWDAVLFPVIVICVMVVWCMGTLALFGYKITLLTGLLPPIIVVIGIPNCVYLLNRYHQEFHKTGDQTLSLHRVVSKIGIVTFITNFTTAIGFGVLAFTDIIILKEFGVVASLNVLFTFIVSIILIPSVFSYLPPPNSKRLRHLSFKAIDRPLTGLDILVHRHRYSVLLVSAVVVIICVVGVMKIQAVSFMVDDIPEDNRIKQDLRFFETHFSGVMPLEVVIDTKKPKGIMNLNVLKKVDQLEQFLVQTPYVSEPVSIVSFVKAGRQAFYNNKPSFYDLPNSHDKNFILRYFRGNDDQTSLMSSFADSSGRFMRVSMNVADVGSNKMNALVNNYLKPGFEEIFKDSDIDVNITGTTLLFIQGNKFLIENLRTSLILAFCIIAVIMAALFSNVRMIFISLIPNIIPLLITGALMGYFGIPLKPSTALIFSIAFGISVDDSIHFLAKYRQELLANNFFVPLAVSRSIRETGSSMIYTSIVLFSGFVIFSFSDFGGTVALGILTSTTLLMAMFTNLIVLPSLLLIFDDGKHKNDFYPPLIDYYEGVYREDEDEEIDLDKLEVKRDEEEPKDERRLVEQ
jgi:uncharacterized protein